jgi:hypothetical protein
MHMCGSGRGARHGCTGGVRGGSVGHVTGLFSFRLVQLVDPR